MHSDRLLLRKAARGCKDSLRRIYEANKDHLLTLAGGMTGDRSLAEDIVHDVFVAFARNVPTLRLTTSLRGYLSVSVCNRVRDVYRAEVRHRLEECQVRPGPADAAAPDARASEAELTGRLRAALVGFDRLITGSGSPRWPWGYTDPCFRGFIGFRSRAVAFQCEPTQCSAPSVVC